MLISFNNLFTHNLFRNDRSKEYFTKQIQKAASKNTAAQRQLIVSNVAPGTSEEAWMWTLVGEEGGGWSKNNIFALSLPEPCRAWVDERR